MNILVTGAAGYIGSTFSFEAVKRGHTIFGIDNFSNSTDLFVKKLKEEKPDDFFFQSCDLRNHDDLHQCFGSIVKEIDISIIIHFAGLKSVPESEEKGEEYWDNNVNGTKNLLDVMSIYNIKNIIFSSSASVYGKQELQPISEDAALNPASMYAKTKKAAEELIQNEVLNNGISGISLRYFNPIGSHKDYIVFEDFDKPYPNLMSSVINVAKGTKEKVLIYGEDYITSDGTGERDYIHIFDLINGHFAALKYLNHVKGYDVFNLGTGKCVSVKELINNFEKVNKVKIPYQKTDRRPGDIATCYADPSKAKKDLKWETKYNLNDMCRDSWEPVKNI